MIVPRWFFIALFSVSCWTMTWPALLADIQSIGSVSFANEHYREDLGFCLLFGMLPPTWVAAPFTTGFYQRGFQVGRRTQ